MGRMEDITVGNPRKRGCPVLGRGGRAMHEPYIWTPPAMQAHLGFWIQGRTADNISGLSMRPSTRALMTFARRSLATLSVSEPPLGLSGFSCAGLTCFHQPLRTGNSGRVIPPRSRPWGPGVQSTSDCGHLRSGGSIFAAMGKDRPGDTGMFRGERNGCHVHMPALLQSACPRGLGVGLFVEHT